MSGSDESPRSGEPAAERIHPSGGEPPGRGVTRTSLASLVNHRTRRSEPGLDGGTRRRAGGGAPPGGRAGVKRQHALSEEWPTLMEGRTGKPGTSHPAPTGRSRACGCSGGRRSAGSLLFRPKPGERYSRATTAGRCTAGRSWLCGPPGKPSRRSRANTAPPAESWDGDGASLHGRRSRFRHAVPASIAFRPHRIAPARFRPPGGCRLSTRPTEQTPDPKYPSKTGCSNQPASALWADLRPNLVDEVSGAAPTGSDDS